MEGIPNVAKHDNNNNFFSPDGKAITPYLLYLRNNFALDPADLINLPFVNGLNSILNKLLPVGISSIRIN